MKNTGITTITLLLIALSCRISAQVKPYPFDVKVTGHGNSSIIFIPGFASSGTVWDETRAQFEKDHTCYTLTMAGFAGVPPQPGASIVNWENEIARYIREQKISRPVVVGHSMGGGLALAIAADYPALVKSIVVVDALPCLPALMDPAFKVKESNDCSEMEKRVVGMTDDAFRQMQKMSAARLVADPEKQELMTEWSMQTDRNTFAQMFCDFSNTDLRDKIKAIQCPALILLEPYFKNIEADIKAQYQNAKTANLQYATKGLHFIMYDDKDWYFSQLNGFIRAK